MTPVCVLRTSAEYQPRHVQWLARQVPGLVCIADQDVPGVETIPTKHDWPKWWVKLELFRPDLPQDWLYIDLDTVVIGDIKELDVGRSTMLSDFYRPDRPASGLMYIKDEDKTQVWREWTKDPASHIKRCTTGDAWGDQGFLKDVFPCARWQDLMPGRVISYKAGVKKGVSPKTANIVCFHGNPRPWQVKADWIPPL